MTRKTLLRPRRFAHWGEYGDAYGLDVVDPDTGDVRCRRCGTSFYLRAYRGKLYQRAHVCPNECNGRLRRLPPALPAPPVVLARQDPDAPARAHRPQKPPLHRRALGTACAGFMDEVEGLRRSGVDLADWVDERERE